MRCSMKKIILLLSSLFLVFSNMKADDVIDEKLADIFVSTDDKIVENGSCSWECRDVNDGYVTQIIGFDFKSGTTYCKVFASDNLDLDLGVNATRVNTACALNVTQIESEYNSLIGDDGKGGTTTQKESSISYTQSDSKLTYSNFLTSLVTLNPNVIDRSQTKSLGEITLASGKELYSITNISRNTSDNMSENSEKGSFTAKLSYYIHKWNEIPPVPVGEKTLSSKTSAVDGFNKNNMAYFSDLFLNMEEIYQHLQILIFVMVGGFFVTQIGASKLQAYLENRGESAGNQPYLHKFYIPLIMAGTFFMPIPESDDLAHSTIVQNIIRYFATHSNNLADMASAVGAKTYMDKIYKNTGGLDDEGIKNVLTNYYLQDHIATQGASIFNNTCKQRYGDRLSIYNTNSINFLIMTDEEKQNFRRQFQFDTNGISGTKNDISFESCMKLEMDIEEAKITKTRIEEQKKTIQNFRDQVSTDLSSIDSYFAIREQQLGWLNSLLTPSSAILVETYTFADKVNSSSAKMEEATKKNAETMKRAINDGKIKIEDDISDSKLGWIAGKMVWMLMPGAMALKDFVMDNVGKVTGAIGAGLGMYGGPVGSIVGGLLGGIIGKITGTISGYVASVYLLEWTFEKIPLLVCTTASVVAFVAYLVSLCKYFYISPFAVAYSMATKRMDKIIDFLIAGFSIFLKPVLIVLFIYLALFLYVLIDELFVFLSVEQFTGIESGFFDFHTNFISGAITGLLVIFGKISSGYLMWKLIVSGPGWTLGLLGIDGKQDDVIAGGIEAHLAKRAFIA